MEGIKPRKNEIDDIHRPLDLIPPGLSHRHANLNGKCYRVPFIITISELVNHYITADNEHLDYIYGEPALAKCIGTIFLIHGFQDISFGWRNQIPTLIEEGFRTVAIDCIGYEGTEAPSVPPESISNYTFKQCADDVAELARQLKAPRVILGGHDWGGLIITRVYLYYPSLVAGLFSAGTPYLPPEPRWLEWDKYVEKLPTFKYQKHFGSTELELQIQTREAIRQFFITGYYGRGPNREMPFSTEGALVCN